MNDNKKVRDIFVAPISAFLSTLLSILFIERKSKSRILASFVPEIRAKTFEYIINSESVPKSFIIYHIRGTYSAMPDFMQEYKLHHLGFMQTNIWLKGSRLHIRACGELVSVQGSIITAT